MRIGTDMEWQTLESRMFVSSAYDAGRHLLYLRFQSGDVYRYFDVPAERSTKRSLKPSPMAATSSAISATGFATNA